VLAKEVADAMVTFVVALTTDDTAPTFMISRTALRDGAGGRKGATATLRPDQRKRAKMSVPTA
jgi:hypothetical protein